LGALDGEYFKAIGIIQPLPLQILCFNFCKRGGADLRHLIQLETGQGKTALCLTIAAAFTKFGRRVLIINDSEDLTFRDFKKAEMC
jgi:superfamily II DNA or RNA helicase